MGSQHWFAGKLHDLDRAECLELLGQKQVGRIAFADDSGPDVFPVNYVMDGEDVLIATSGYGPLARSGTSGRVAFEVDEIDDHNESGWSVVVRGRASRESAFDLPPELPRPWADGSRTFVLRISPDVVTGRRLLPS